MGWSDKYKKSIDCNNPKGFSQRAHCQGKKKKMNEENKKDHEYSMARSELKTIKNAVSRLQKKMGKRGEGELKAWVQSKITKAADYIDTAADYVTNEETITEKRDGKSAKDPGYSLRDWFKGGGWVQAGGKYDGKPCAKQPGQKTKPFCRDADDRASMSEDERERRAKKKRKEDPNPERKGKAKIVTSEQVRTGPGTPYKNPDDALRKILGPGEKIVPSKPVKLANSHEPKGAIVEQPTYAQKIGRDMTVPSNVYQGNPDLRASLQRRGSDLSRQDRRYFKGGGGYARMQNDNKTMQQVVDMGRKNQERLASKQVNTANWTDKQGRKVYAGSPEMRFNVQNSFEPQGEVIGEEGKKDACYKKVKSRYSVWPSAYASGALVKCRKVGAANWGNKTKNENYNYSNWRDEFKALEIESIDIIKPEPLQATDGIGSRMLEEGKGKKCWKGYKKAGTQELFGKTYNRCVKEGNKSFDQFMEDWQKVNKSDKTDGMSSAAVKAYRRENPGSKLKTAVTGDPKPGSKDAKRRKSFCSRSKGQQDMHNIDCSKTPDKAICKARKRWRC
jgi:hypothetical protein